MKKFYVVDDYTSIAIWDAVLNRVVPRLASRPKGWDRPEQVDIPEGDWTLEYIMHQHARGHELYITAGIPKPSFQQLPAVFCVDETGIVGQFNVTAENAGEFITANLSTKPSTAV